MRIANVIKTAPRDLRLIYRYGKTMIEASQIEKSGGSIGKIFDKLALQHPEKPAILFKDEVWTFRQVYERSNKIANMFLQFGLKKSDKVSLLMENRPEYICTWLAMSKIGVITALLNFNLRSLPLKHSFDLVDAKAIICGSELSEAFNDAFQSRMPNKPIFETGNAGEKGALKNAYDLDREVLSRSSSTPLEQENTGYLDEFLCLFTSGTTGLPKATIIKQCRFMMGGIAGKNVNKIGQNDIIYVTLPLYHTNSGIVGASQPIINGATMVLREKFSASQFWTDCIKYKVTAAQYMGETMRYLLRQPPSPEEKLHNVRAMFGNGLRAEIWEEFVQRFGIKHVSEIYGATEGNVSIVNNEQKVGACGFIPLLLKSVLPMTIIKLDENEKPVRDPKTGLIVECEPGEVGELVGKIQKNHPFRDFKGYTSDKKANEKKVLSDVFKKGDSAFRTGDLFVKDELGFLYFKDRMGDAFRWKGENVSSTECEYVISNLTSQKLDTVVFSVKVPHTDGQPGMVVIADEGNSLDITELSNRMKKALPQYAIPLFLRIVNHIEMTGTHKMKKTDFQKEGFDVSKISDKLFHWSIEHGKYVSLTKDLYNRVMEGNIKL